MAKNTGKPAEKEFEAKIAALGKRAYLYRFDDASSFYGLAGKAGNVKAQPSDYLLIKDGKSEFCEVKSTEHPKLFSFSLLRATQVGKAKQITSAGGSYTVYVKSIVSGLWFVAPYTLITAYQAAGRSSVTFAELPTWTP